MDLSEGCFTAAYYVITLLTFMYYFVKQKWERIDIFYSSHILHQFLSVSSDMQAVLCSMFVL